MFKDPKIIELFLQTYLKKIKSEKVANLWGATNDPFTESIPNKKYSKLLCINKTESGELERRFPKKVINGHPINTIDKINEIYDVLIGNFPLYMHQPVKEITLSNIKIKDSLGELIIAKSLKNLSENGKGIFMVRSSFFSVKKSNALVDQINKLGAFVEAVISVPAGSFDKTMVPALILIISKNEPKKLFIAELPEITENISELVENLVNHMRGDSEPLGELVDPTNFSDFKSHVATKEVLALLNQYRDLKLHNMGDINVEINMTKDKFFEKPNSIYLPKLGNSIVLDSIQNLKIKPQNYFQIVLNKNVVGAKYLAQFFNTFLGKKLRKSIETGTVIRHISKKDLIKLKLPLPDIKTQEAIVIVKIKLIHLQNELDIYEKNLATAPKDVHEIDKKLISIIESIEIANLNDRVLQLIRKGESKKLEFKSTLRVNLYTKKPDKKIEHSTLKTIVAFMNTTGGTLLVGVEDDGNILGIEKDKFSNEDKFLLHFKSLLKDQIGLEFDPLIDFEICKSNGKNVLIVDCKPSNKPVFLKDNNGEKFYIRTNPASDLLEGSKLIEYINRRFH